MKYVIFWLALCLAACSDNTNGNAIGNKAEAESIEWFEGNLDEAFKLAKQEDKPIFLYWGAVWCPPCQEIKQTVFKSRRFISLSDSFVPIYLDGDTARAQTAGERFGVKGYPTMIVFSAAGQEITRIPGGINISKYNDILAASLNSITPTATLVEMVNNGSGQLSESDFQQLAYYSWSQDQEALPEDYTPALFLKMSNASKEPMASARLYMQYLSEVASSTTAESESTITPDALQRVTRILEDDSLTLACWEYFAYETKDLMPVIVDRNANPDLTKMLSGLWQSKMIALSNSKVLSTAEQLAGFLPAIHYYYEDDETRQITPEFKQQILSATQKADRMTKNSFARQSVVSQMNYVLQSADLTSDAKALLINELEKSKAPYYFMSSLSSIAEKDGDDETAIEWKRKAFEASEGAATRFQWGANYVRTLVRLTPDNEALIVTTAFTLVAEIDSGEDVFSGRNFSVLRAMTKSLNQWSEENGLEGNKILGDYTKMIKTGCNAQKAESAAFKNCSSLI
jgi:thioredoxin-related protein